MVNASKTPTKQNSQIEQQLRFQSNVLNLVAESVIATDNKGKITYWNKASEKLYGWKAEEAVGKMTSDLLVPQNSKEEIREITKEAYLGKAWAGTLQVKGKDGVNFWVLLNIIPLTEDGQINGIIGTSSDITERKKSEEALRESEERFSKAFQHSPTAMVISSPAGVIVDINDAFTKLLGYDRQDVIGKQGNALGLYAIPSERQELIRQLSEKGHVSNFEMTFRHKSGKPVSVIFALERITVNGQPHLLGTGIDVTERKKIEEALIGSQRDLLRAQSVAKIGNWRVMAHSNELFWSDETYNVFGVQRGTPMTYQKFLSIVHPDDRSFVDQSWGEALKGKKYDIQHRIIVDGKIKWVRETAELEFSDGELVSGFGTVQDISDTKNVQEELKRSEERFYKAFDSNPAAISISRFSDGFLVNVNETYLQLFEYCRQEVIGHTSTELGIFVGSNDRAKLTSLLNKKGQFRNQETTFITKTGKRIQVLVSMDKFNVDGVDYIISTVADISERKAIELKLKEYTRDLEKLVEERTKQLKDSERLAAIGATAGMVGHDIRNPLQAIVSDVYLLKESLANMPECVTKEDVDDSLDGIESNILYINKIVADLQDYARPITPQHKAVILNHLLEEVLSLKAIPQNIEVSYSVDRATENIATDPELLKRVLANLVDNAVQAMPQGGKITIQASRKAGNTEITVEDTGAGIAEEVKSKLFTPLFTTKSKGQGFGLAVVKRVIVALGGTVDFESKEGKGTKFIIELPATS